MPQIYRDNADNFYVDGRKIELPEFKSLGINADFVPRGATVDWQQAVNNVQPQAQQPTANSVTGDPTYDELLKTLQGYLDQLQKRGQVLNPNIEITPDQVAAFTKQAETEIDPYYSTQLKLAREGFLRDVGYSQDQVLQRENELEKQYGRRVRDIGESAAERGFTLSGIRQREEGDLATDTQGLLDEARRGASFQAGSRARTFAQQFGGLQGQGIPGAPNVGAAPRVLPGQPSFQRPSTQNPFYELSPDVYSGLVGEQEFQRRAAIRGRSAGLEEAERRRRALEQQRNLNF